MGIDYKFNRSFSGEGVTPVSGEKSITEGAIQARLSESIPDESTDLHLLANIDISQLTAFYMNSTQDVTVEINHPAGTSTAADQTFTLLANQPILWLSGDAVDNPLDQDVTDIYVTNASGSDATFDLIALGDPTP